MEHEDAKELEFYEAGAFNRYLFAKNNQPPTYEDFEIIPERTLTSKKMIKNTLTYWNFTDFINKKIAYLTSIDEISNNLFKKQYMSLLFKECYGSEVQREEAILAAAQLHFSGHNACIERDLKQSEQYFEFIVRHAKNNNYKKIAHAYLEKIKNLLNRASSPEGSDILS